MGLDGAAIADEKSMSPIGEFKDIRAQDDDDMARHLTFVKMYSLLLVA